MFLRVCHTDAPGTPNRRHDAGLPAVLETIQNTDWSTLTFVQVGRDERNYCEISGSSKPNEGFCLSVTVEGVNYVGATAPSTPEDAIPAFDFYLRDMLLPLFRIIFDADRMGLSDEEVIQQQESEAEVQRLRMAREAAAKYGVLFSEKKYAEYVKVMEPHADSLTGTDEKKLAMAKKKIDLS